MNNVELVLKNSLGQSTVVDVNDFPYRLNRKVFTASNDKLKVLGGTFSTQIELSKSKKNNKFFVGKTEVKSTKKFYNLNHYEAVLYENGVEVIRGKFKLEEITNNSYLGTFFDNDIDWVEDLSKVQLNQLGYVDGAPTWLVDFNGATTFDAVNDLTNRETDFICPTLIYNNTPITDYNDLTDDDIWGVFELPLADPPVRLTSGGDYPNDFETRTGFFGDRLGVTFEDFPPALYYRNVLERCIHEIGFEIECPLFDEEWFNQLYMTYSGDGYKYNWKNLATVASYTPATVLTGVSETDGIMFVEDYNLSNVADLANASGGSPISNWVTNPKIYFKTASVLVHDDNTSPIFLDKITAYNKFNIPGQYICPADGQYEFKIKGGYNNIITDFVTEYDTPSNPSQLVWRGSNLVSAYGSQDADSSQGQPTADRRYSWDDATLVIMRKNQSNNYSYAETETMLKDWLSGENKDFTTTPSDVVAYFSPKRYAQYIAAACPEIEAVGSPNTNWETEVIVNAHDYIMQLDSIPTFESDSYADIEITIDLLKNERIEVYWISLGEVQGNAATWISAGAPFLDSSDEDTYVQTIGQGVIEPAAADHSFNINYLCGNYDLDLATNLPNITAKQFLTSFINEFNLYFNVDGNVIQFLPQTSYYTPETYDITSRILNDNWSAEPIETPKELTIGYNIDNNDRLLSNIVSNCITDDSFISSYGNVVLTNDNIYGSNFVNNTSIFSSTRFHTGDIVMWPYASVTITVYQSVDPASDYRLNKGFTFSIAGPASFPLEIPSIQSDSSYNEANVGDLTYNYNYTPRLLYNLGTVTSYLGVSSLQGALIDSPRGEAAFCRLAKHWYRPTVSAFHEENNNPYRTLRYDTSTGLYNVYFENLVDLYNQSEVLTLQMAMRNIDWVNMKGSKKIRYLDGIYRLMSVEQYDPLTNAPCTIKLLKEI